MVESGQLHKRQKKTAVSIPEVTVELQKSWF